MYNKYMQGKMNVEQKLVHGDDCIYFAKLVKIIFVHLKWINSMVYKLFQQSFKKYQIPFSFPKSPR